MVAILLSSPSNLIFWSKKTCSSIAVTRATAQTGGVLSSCKVARNTAQLLLAALYEIT